VTSCRWPSSGACASTGGVQPPELTTSTGPSWRAATRRIRGVSITMSPSAPQRTTSGGALMGRRACRGRGRREVAWRIQDGRPASVTLRADVAKPASGSSGDFAVKGEVPVPEHGGRVPFTHQGRGLASQPFGEGVVAKHVEHVAGQRVAVAGAG